MGSNTFTQAGKESAGVRAAAPISAGARPLLCYYTQKCELVKKKPGVSLSIYLSSNLPRVLNGFITLACVRNSV